MYVHPAHYGQGIGTRLLERLERTAVDRGARSLELTVFATNERARSFYESFGFEQYDTAFDNRFEVERIRYERTID
ncbi:GNAT family N-acetyltransferase [Halovivax ruber]|uniref:GNAT family N-acetyltransferase n=1 Tax=Halovivax ruber TaxID=387341 RepID=UPI00373AF1CC